MLCTARAWKFMAVTMRSGIACSRLQEVLQSRGVLPEGSLRAQIRWSKRFGPEIKTGTLGDTLGQERCGIVVVDGACNPMSHAGIKELGSIVATQEYRLDVHLPNPDGRGWSRSATGRWWSVQRSATSA